MTDLELVNLIGFYEPAGIEEFVEAGRFDGDANIAEIENFAELDDKFQLYEIRNCWC